MSATVTDFSSQFSDNFYDKRLESVIKTLCQKIIIVGLIGLATKTQFSSKFKLGPIPPYHDNIVGLHLKIAELKILSEVRSSLRLNLT